MRISALFLWKKRRASGDLLLHYILSTDVLNDRNQVLQLAKDALNHSQNEKQAKRSSLPASLRSLPNLQASTVRILKKAGIDSVENLYRVGAANAFLAIQASNNLPVKLELLWALEGAIQGVHWSVVPNQRRNELIQLIEAAWVPYDYSTQQTDALLPPFVSICSYLNEMKTFRFMFGNIDRGWFRLSNRMFFPLSWLFAEQRAIE